MECSDVCNVPEGMSPVNTFYSLWINAESEPFLACDTIALRCANLTVNTPDKVARVFADSLDLGVVGGRGIHVDFSTFPMLNFTKYNNCNNTSAEEILAMDHKCPSSWRFDKGDSMMSVVDDHLVSTLSDLF